jgi:hypothetical protein
LDRTAEPADDVWIHPCVGVRRSSGTGEGLFATTWLDADVVVIASADGGSAAGL